ncbi:uncharacterized protein (DUF305 family) [Pseudonocardia sediminis]|uniref:Uncharacterized protein (DUF305 family) n=1 Tax=Pseudonocardia sediminis TaxID=1397368 RepID=A0A4Q7V837_PSEST|nr:DUF305 domain-containing protein [Pseudonocardia sediminis]RZT88993.1 uncharacterized protein (DUF305 family) [Pseudonocardia sediminis]
MATVRTASRAVLVVAAFLAVAAACSRLSATEAPEPAPAGGPTAVDAAFVQHMLPHHRRAIEVGELAAARGTDPRVRAFGRRIVAEQTPEEQRLTSWVTELGLTPQSGDATAAAGWIDDATLARLTAAPAAEFDRDVLLASADSETGAAEMSRLELDGGTFGPARELATSISTAPTGELPELRRLAADLPGS